MVVIAVVGFLAFAIFMVSKMVGRNKDIEADDGKVLDTITGGDTDQEDTDSADETDSLLTPTKKTTPSSPITKFGRRLKESTERLFGSVPK